MVRSERLDELTLSLSLFLVLTECHIPEKPESALSQGIHGPNFFIDLEGAWQESRGLPCSTGDFFSAYQPIKPSFCEACD